jgi:hypothetical protein
MTTDTFNHERDVIGFPFAARGGAIPCLQVIFLVCTREMPAPRVVVCPARGAGKYAHNPVLTLHYQDSPVKWEDI